MTEIERQRKKKSELHFGSPNKSLQKAWTSRMRPSESVHTLWVRPKRVNTGLFGLAPKKWTGHVWLVQKEWTRIYLDRVRLVEKEWTLISLDAFGSSKKTEHWFIWTHSVQKDIWTRSGRPKKVNTDLLGHVLARPETANTDNLDAFGSSKKSEHWFL
jgi:hypothetical protein